MSDIRVWLRPTQSFVDAAINITALWRLTKQNVPYDQTEQTLRALAAQAGDGFSNPAARAQWADVAAHARRVMLADLPLAHYVHFTLVVEGHSRAFLDQFVRELVTGIEVWTGSNRIQDMSRYDELDVLRDCETVRSDPDKSALRAQHHSAIAEMVRTEMAAGFTIEEAREILPMAVSLPVTCTTSLRRLRWIMSKRTSFVLQKSLWGPVIAQILEQLAQWDSDIGQQLRVPPCILRGECPYAIDIEERSTPRPDDAHACTQVDAIMQPHTHRAVDGSLKPSSFKDPNPICPIYIDRFAGDQRASLLMLARQKTQGYDQIAADYFKYVNLAPQHILLPNLP